MRKRHEIVGLNANEVMDKATSKRRINGHSDSSGYGRSSRDTKKAIVSYFVSKYCSNKLVSQCFVV